MSCVDPSARPAWAPCPPQAEGLGVGLASRWLPEETGQEGPGRGPAAPGRGCGTGGCSRRGAQGVPESSPRSKVTAVGHPKAALPAAQRGGPRGQRGGCEEAAAGSPQPPNPGPHGALSPLRHSHTSLQIFSVLASTDVVQQPGGSGAGTPRAPRAWGMRGSPSAPLLGGVPCSREQRQLLEPLQEGPHVCPLVSCPSLTVSRSPRPGGGQPKPPSCIPQGWGPGERNPLAINK